MYYTESHEWTDQLDGTAKIGVSNFAQEELGDIVFVELPKVGTAVEAGQELAVLESTKAAADVYAPLSGKVIEVNERLAQDPGLINRSPEGEGWILKLEITSNSAKEKLMDQKKYREQIG